MNTKSLTFSCLLAFSLLQTLQASGENVEQPTIRDTNPVKTLQLISLKIGESAELDASGLILKFVDIKKDSRCPRNTACIQEGQVTAVFKIFNQRESKGKTFELTLKALQPKLSNLNIEGYNVQLNRVDPYPEAEMAKTDRTYVVKLSLEPID